MSRGTTKDDATFRFRLSPLTGEFPSLFEIILLRIYGSLMCDTMSPADASLEKASQYLLRAIDARTIELGPGVIGPETVIGGTLLRAVVYAVELGQKN